MNLKDWCEPGMKKFLLKLAAMMIIMGMLCAQTAAVYAIKELGAADFSDWEISARKSEKGRKKNRTKLAFPNSTGYHKRKYRSFPTPTTAQEESLHVQR